MSQEIARSTVSAAQRSTFVTVLSWVLIVGSGFFTLIAVMQALMMLFVMPMEWSKGPPKGIEAFPPIAQFLLSNVRLFFLLNWLAIIFTFASSIGLLHRKNWARIAIICVFAIGVVVNLGGIWLQSEMFSSFPKFSA